MTTSSHIENVWIEMCRNNSNSCQIYCQENYSFVDYEKSDCRNIITDYDTGLIVLSSCMISVMLLLIYSKRYLFYGCFMNVLVILNTTSVPFRNYLEHRKWYFSYIWFAFFKLQKVRSISKKFNFYYTCRCYSFLSEEVWSSHGDYWHHI